MHRIKGFGKLAGMLALGLDTATMLGSVGVYDDGPLGEVSVRRQLRKDDAVMPSIEHLLTHLQVEKSQIELISVALGPGSFTGLRVGLSLAKGLSMGLDIPVVGVPSLPLFAERVSNWQRLVCSMVSDRKDRAYVAWYRHGEEQESVEAMEIETLQAKLKTVSEPTLMIGPGADVIHAQLDELDNVILASDDLNRPSALSVAKMGIEQFKRNGADDVATLEPIYCQPPAIDPGVLQT